MRSILSKLVLASTVAAGTILAANVASAETLHVPFDFTVAGKLCPAGNYSVQRANTDVMVVTMTSKEKRNGFKWIVGPGAPQPTDGRIILSFDQAGSVHALRTIQYGPLITRNLDGKLAKHDKGYVVRGE